MSERPQTASPIATEGRERPSAGNQRSDRIAVSALTLNFLAWLAAGPRLYAEVMEAWRTSCPSLTIWEDALADGLVVVTHHPGGRASDMAVALIRNADEDWFILANSWPETSPSPRSRGEGLG